MTNPNLHAIVIFFARTTSERDLAKLEHQKFVAQCKGVEILSWLDLDAVPPLEYSHDHFGYRDRLSEPPIEGSGVEVPISSDTPRQENSS